MISALEVWALAGQGGAPSFFKTLEGYGRRGHQVDVVSSRIGANHHFGAPPQEPPEIPGVRFHLFDLPSLAESRLPLPNLAKKADQKLRFAALFPLMASRRAEALLKQQSYDLLYGYEVHGTLATRILKRRHKLPNVARFQGTVMYPYLDKLMSLLRKYEEVRALKTPADLYVMTNDGTQGDKVLARLNPASAGKVRFWRNGLDLNNVRHARDGEAALERQRLGIAKDELLLVTTTRLARWKRVDRAIDAVAALRGRGLPARLIVVGDGEERANLERQADALELQPFVSFTGAVPQTEVQRYLWAADVFLSINELSNVGNPLLEAMLSGCCILTIDEGETRELIEDGETGVLLDFGEPMVIAEALAKLHADPQRRQKMAQSAQRFGEANFWSWQERIDAEVDAVEALVPHRALANA